MFGRYEFVVRRIHSLLGLIPIGGYVCFHLATNAAILDGLATYQRRADQIHVIGPTTLFVLEWSVIFLPILFHGLVGLVIVTRGKRNLQDYPFLGNWRYTLQRITAVIALVFILWHVFQMRGWFEFDWWLEHVTRPLGGAKFDPTSAATAPEVFQGSALFSLLYVVGVVAVVYHLANGLWTMGITWGVWTSPSAQRWANVPCAAFGAALLIVGLGSVYGMLSVELPQDAGNSAHAVSAPQRSDAGLQPSASSSQLSLTELD